MVSTTASGPVRVVAEIDDSGLQVFGGIFEESDGGIVVPTYDASVEPSSMAVVEAWNIAAVLGSDWSHWVPTNQAPTLLGIIASLKLSLRHPSAGPTKTFLHLPFGSRLTKLLDVAYQTLRLASHDVVCISLEIEYPKTCSMSRLGSGIL